ncbi:MAG: LamG-like jellyroll fold domain-containing protein [Anaerohalosphaeraceae bacterium]
MNPVHRDPQFVDQLTHLLMLSMEGSITEAEFRQLNKLLTDSAAARQLYYDFVASYIGLNDIETLSMTEHSQSAFLDENLWSCLADVEKTAPAICLPKANEHLAEQPVPRDRIVHNFSKMSLFSLIVSAAAILLLIFFARTTSVTTVDPVAKLVNTIEAKWENASGQILPDCDLYPGPMKLTKGLAEISFDDGAIAVIQAPAQFTLESANQLYLQQGQAVIRIDKTSETPFVVRSPQASVVDYGTEFGICIDSFNNTLTHVYQGKVELRSGSNPLRFEQRLTLTESQAGQASTLGKLSKKQGISGLFIRPDEFDARLKAAEGSAYDRWMAYSYQLRRDPDVIAYYTFEKDPANPDNLINLASSTMGSLKGTLCSLSNKDKPTWTKGRWPQKTALQFDRSQKQQVEVAADPKLCIDGPVTVAAWIYCTDEKDGGHILSNRIAPQELCNYQLGYRSPSSPEWKQNIHLARKKNTEDAKNQIYSTKISEQFGWIHIAATHDNQTIKFYLNGVLVDSKNWPYKQPLAEAGLFIGTDSAPNDGSRFNGKMDEIVILGRVMTDSEIADMYQAGRP